MATTTTPTCHYCHRSADEIPEVQAGASDNDLTPEEYARDDGTFNRTTNEFCCDRCYIDLGMPSSSVGWVAGDPIEQTTG